MRMWIGMGRGRCLWLSAPASMPGVISSRLGGVEAGRDSSDRVTVPLAGSQSESLTLTQLLSGLVLRQMCNSHLMHPFSSKFRVRCWLSGLVSSLFFVSKLSLLCLNKGLYHKNVYIFFWTCSHSVKSRKKFKNSLCFVTILLMR